MPLHQAEPNRLGPGGIVGLLLPVSRPAISLDCEESVGFEGNVRFDSGGLGRVAGRHRAGLRLAVPALAQKPHQPA